MPSSLPIFNMPVPPLWRRGMRFSNSALLICRRALHLRFALMPSWLALAHRALSGAPRLAVFVEDHSGSGVEIDLGRLSEAGHHHVESDGEDRFHDFLRTEILAHRGEGRVGHSDILDHLPPERQQRAFGVIEGLVLIVAAFNAINLPLLHTDAESNRSMLAPLVGSTFPFRDQKDQQLSIDVTELLLMQD